MLAYPGVAHQDLDKVWPEKRKKTAATRSLAVRRRDLNVLNPPDKDSRPDHDEGVGYPKENTKQRKGSGWLTADDDLAGGRRRPKISPSNSLLFPVLFHDEISTRTPGRRRRTR